MAASGDFDFELKTDTERRVTLDVFVLFAQTHTPIVLLVPHIRLKPGEAMPWRVIATGSMKSAQLAEKQQQVHVVRQADATMFYGVARPQNSVTITFYGEGSGPEQVAFVGPALILRVPGPFIRVANGFAVVALPGIGQQEPSISTVVGGSGESALGVGDQELAINLTMTRRLRGYQMTAINPSPISDEPFKWKATGYMQVSATGIDPAHGDDTERKNIYAGLLLGFALSLLFPFVNATRRAGPLIRGVRWGNKLGGRR